MGYMHIENLYRPAAQSILAFRECYALEKIHGTSAHIAWNGSEVRLSSGGEKHERFAGLFDAEALTAAFRSMGHPAIVVYGEAYGGSQQGQSWRYGKSLRFAAFDVKVGETWLAVPSAHQLVTEVLGLEFVHFAKVSTDLSALDAERDAPSEQALRNGIEGDQPREGVVLRPLFECRLNNGERIIAKHKRDDERETKTPRAVVDPSKLVVLQEAEAIAEEWVTPTRLRHVLGKLPGDPGIEAMRDVIAAMTADVLREGAGEFVESREAGLAISRKTAQVFKAHLQAKVTSR